MIKKIILGTAQFGGKYGIKNIEGIIPKNEIKNIFSLLKKKNINSLDTAINYGESEKNIGELKKGVYKIITKLPKIPNKYDSKKKINIWVENEISRSLKRLKAKQLYAVLLHHPEELLEKKGVYIYDALKSLKQNKKIQNIGISVYSTKILKKIVKKFKINIIQIPMNIFDRRILKPNIMNFLKENKIEIHARSIFLQGLLLLENDKIPKYFHRWSKLFKIWDNWIKKNNISRLEACLCFINIQKEIDKIVIGIDNSQQLKQILKIKPKVNLGFPNINCIDKKLINPSFWKN